MSDRVSNKASESNTWSQYKSCSRLLQAIAQVLFVAENILEETDLKVFQQNLLIEIQKRWNN